VELFTNKMFIGIITRISLHHRRT